MAAPAVSVALLRGVNVGGKRKLPMAKLREAFEAAGCTDVSTYIQSGNVLYRRASGTSAKTRAALEKAVSEAAGFDVDLVLRSVADLRKAVDNNPFSDSPTSDVHVAFVADRVPSAGKARLEKAKRGQEDFKIVGREIYLLLPDGMGRAKLPTALPSLGVPATARNWKTIEKLIELGAAAATSPTS